MGKYSNMFWNSRIGDALLEVWSWIGVIIYIPMAAVRKVLRRVTGNPNLGTHRQVYDWLHSQNAQITFAFAFGMIVILSVLQLGLYDNLIASYIITACLAADIAFILSLFALAIIAGDKPL